MSKQIPSQSSQQSQLESDSGAGGSGINKIQGIAPLKIVDNINKYEYDEDGYDINANDGDDGLDANDHEEQAKNGEVEGSFFDKKEYKKKLVPSAQQKSLWAEAWRVGPEHGRDD